MNHAGFMIDRLALTGPGLADAELSFSMGLNVITGPSDTGKTFAFECIDFMLGASTPPKSIPEADGYDTVCLKFHDHKTNTPYFLFRSLKGGHFRLTTEGIGQKVLRGKHKAGDDASVSQLFLNLINLQDKWIRKNKDGEIRSLSFRDMAHLSIVSEEDIIKKRSPVLSGNPVAATAEKSAYGLLLSAVDDSSIIQKSDTQETKKHFEAKEEVLEELIANVKRKIEEMRINVDLPSLREQLHKLDLSLGESTKSLNDTKATVISLEEARRKAWTSLKQVESRLDVLFELQSRFSLLNKQYHSDVLRLQAISESGKRLGEMRLDHCPVCGASSSNQDPDHQECKTDPISVAASCASEASKVKALIADLELTRKDIEHEIAALDVVKVRAKEDLKKASTELQGLITPRINDIINEMRTNQELRESILKAISLFEQQNEIETLLNGLRSEVPTQSEKLQFAELDNRCVEAFSKAVENRLTAWNFPGLDRVTFDQKECDIVITGRSRISHGKGVRAITHAAFTLSLLRYCFDNNLPHSGIVVIDSPLVVYKEPDAGEEGFSVDLKAAFYRDLSQSFSDAQVIIIENNDPPDDLSGGLANIIRFTGSGHGRRGFIPPRGSDRGQLDQGGDVNALDIETR